MGLPILNMDGYLLKQIKAETARANAADKALTNQLNTATANLQAQITDLQNGVVDTAIATAANGFRLISKQELVETNFNGGYEYFPAAGSMLDYDVRVGMFDFLFSGYNSGQTNLLLPWSDTSFNKGQPYRAALGFLCRVVQGSSSVCGFAMDIGPQEVSDQGFEAMTNFQAAFTHFKMSPGVSFDFCAYTPVFAVKQGGFFKKINFQCAAFAAQEDGTPTIKIEEKQPYGKAGQQLFENMCSILLFVDFPETTD